MSLPQVAVIMVTFGAAGDRLRRAIDSLYASSGCSFHLFLICNAAEGYALELCTNRLENCTVVVNSENLYWVGGINQGIALSSAYDYVAFMNDDIVVPPHCLEEMVKVLQNPQVGVVGPLTSNTRDWQGYENFRAGPAIAANVELPAIADIRSADLHIVNDRLQLADLPDALLGVGGMLAFFCVCLRRETIDRVGPLDADFAELMCGDDDDYCRRIAAAGMPYSAVLTKVYVEHTGGASISKSIDSATMLRNRQRAAHLLAKKAG